MIGTTLGDIREHIRSLSDDSGGYYLVCGRTRERPVPAAGLRFESREVARAAAHATEQYRATLRRYDPQVPLYDVIVCEAPGRADDNPPRKPAANTDSAVDFCHTVVGVVFEAIAASAHVGLEDAIMDAYLDAAETVERPNELCLRLLETMAAELDGRVTPSDQATLLAAAAESLPDRQVEEDPIDDAFGGLHDAGLLESYRLEASDTQTYTVEIDGYVLATGDRIVTLPIVVELLGRLPDRSMALSTERVEATRWRMTVSVPGAEPRGLTRTSD